MALTHLLEYSADADARDENQCTPLIYAERKGHAVIVRALLEAGTDVETEMHCSSRCDVTLDDGG